LVLAVVTLPIIPSDWWKPESGTWPSGRILLLLLAKVGAPYFLLSTTGPLIQAWFALANPGKSPYRLYALSNVGSLGALLSYPFVFERILTVNWQGWLWSGAFVGFAALAGGMGLWIWRIAAGLEEEGFEPKITIDGGDAPAKVPATPQWYHQVSWLLLAALPSMTFLAITNHLCQDVAPVPLLFIVPLSLYLLSLIICFDQEAWYSRIFYGLFGALTIALLCGLENGKTLDQSLAEVDDKLSFTQSVNAVLDVPKEIGFAINRYFKTNHNWKVPLRAEEYEDDVYFQAVMYLSALFFGCMLCHGELVKLKPAPRHLTQYYLLISAGGALGGLFVALVSPHVFVRPYELHLSIIGCFTVAMLALFFAGQRFKVSRHEMVQWSAAFACAGCVILIAASLVNMQAKDGVDTIARRRNFYGAIEVRKVIVEAEDENGDIVEHEGRALYHGRILHGFQYMSESRIDRITTYYGPNSGPGLAVRHHPKRVAGEPLSVGVVGLGTGTMAGFAQAGDYFCFYDIDPKIKALHDEGIFQFVQRARKRGADVPIMLGDARLTMEREAKNKSKQYDLIVLDAFSGDAIPAHLLTLESVKIYDELLRRDANGDSTGILAIHISNRYLNLAPVVDALAQKYKFEQVPVDDPGGPDEWDTSSNWILLTRNQDFLDDFAIKAAQAQYTPAKKPEPVLWTDQWSNLLSILKPS
jgi:spermidine synthase